MSLTDIAFRTIKCDGPDCGKEVTYNPAEEKAVFENPANVWLKSLRLVQTLDGRKFAYHDDVCEINGAKTGQHNLPEPKKIIEASNPAAIAAAYAAAEAAKTSDENLKRGSGGPVLVTG